MIETIGIILAGIVSVFSIAKAISYYVRKTVRQYGEVERTQESIEEMESAIESISEYFKESFQEMQELFVKRVEDLTREIKGYQDMVTNLNGYCQAKEAELQQIKIMRDKEITDLKSRVGQFETEFDEIKNVTLGVRNDLKHYQKMFEDSQKILREHNKETDLTLGVIKQSVTQVGERYLNLTDDVKEIKNILLGDIRSGNVQTVAPKAKRQSKTRV